MKTKNVQGLKSIFDSKRNQIVFFVSILVLINSLFILLYLPYQYKTILINKKENEIKNIATLAGYSIALAVDLNDESEMFKAVKVFQNLNNFKAVQICDTNFTRILAINMKDIDIPKKEGLITDYDGGYMSYTIPIYTQFTQIRTGYIYIRFSLQDLQHDIYSVQITALIISIASLVLGILMTIIITNLFTKPLKQLKEVFADISGINLTKRASIRGNNEFSSLATSFNLMVDRLGKAYSEISEINKNLEMRVEERSQTLYEEIEVRKIAQNSLFHTNRLISGIINASPLPILSLDSKGRIQSVSPIYYKLLGYKCEDVIDTLPPFKNMYEMKKYYDAISHALEFTMPQSINTILLSKTLDERIVQIHISPIANSENQSNFLIGIMDDITERIHREEALAESEEKYRLLIDYSRVGIGIFKGLNCVFANMVLVEIWEYSDIEEFYTIDLSESIFAQSRLEFLQIFDVNQSTSEGFEFKISTKNQTIKYIEATKTIINYKGEVLVQIAFLDISERIKVSEEIRILNQELEQRVLERTSMLNDALEELKSEINNRKEIEVKLQFSDRILQRVGTMVLVADKDTNIIYVSPYIKTLLGYDIEEVLGQKWWDIYSQNSDDKAKQQKYVTNCIRGIINPHEKPYEKSIATKTGEIKWIQWLDVIGDSNTMIAVGNDITEKTIATKNLKKARMELEKTLSKERELGELKTRFVSMISHEYRTPLTVILSSSNIISKLLVRNEPEKISNFIQKIEISVQSMVKLLEDVLVIGRSEAGTIAAEYSPVNIESVVKNIISDMQSAHHYSNYIDLSIEGDFSEIMTDEKLLKQILSNLISNALKYSPNNTTVKIHLIKTDINYSFTIIDSGIGIGTEDLKHLFDSFYRGRNVGTISGTGLGMPILKRGVEILNGSIDVFSEINKGTTFRVILPIKD